MFIELLTVNEGIQMFLSYNEISKNIINILTLVCEKINFDLNIIDGNFN